MAQRLQSNDSAIDINGVYPLLRAFPSYLQATL
jgi:hypothetical protein